MQDAKLAREAHERGLRHMQAGGEHAKNDDMTGSGWAYQAACAAIAEYEQACACFRDAETRDPGNPEHRHALVQCLGRIDDIASYNGVGPAVEAVRLELLAMARAKVRTDPDNPLFTESLLRALAGFVDTSSTDNADRVRATYNELVEARRQQMHAQPGDVAALTNFRNALEAKVRAAERAKLTDDAVRGTQELLHLQVQMLPLEQEYPEQAQHSLITRHYDLVRLATEAGLSAEAEQAYAGALDLAEQASESMSERNLGLVSRDLGNKRGLSAQLSEALAERTHHVRIAIERHLAKGDPERASSPFGIGSALTEYGDWLAWKGREDRAKSVYREAIAILPGSLVGETGWKLALLHKRLGELDDARDLLREILEYRREFDAQYDRFDTKRAVSEALRELGEIDLFADCGSKARTHFAESLAISDKLAEPGEDTRLTGPNPNAIRDQVISLVGLARAYQTLGHRVGARECLGRALEITRPRASYPLPGFPVAAELEGRQIHADTLEAAANIERAFDNDSAADAFLAEATSVREEIAAASRN